MLSLLFALSWGCGPNQTPPVIIISQNAGTTPLMDALEETPLRAICEEYYSNNLCLLDSEQALAAALQQDGPTLALFQELWSREAWCAAADRPEEAQTEPFACAGQGPQLERVLPEGLSWTCSAGYPDNCIAWDSERFVPEIGCTERDCGEQLEDLSSSCAPPGRIALLEGTLDGVPTTVVVVHTRAGFTSEERACRVEQLEGLAVRLQASSAARIVVAGDFNLNPDETAPTDSQAFHTMLDAVGLRRVEDDGDTFRLIEQDLDAVAVLGLPDVLACSVRFVDEDISPWMFDHGMLSCR